jgi:hypothetical protein
MNATIDGTRYTTLVRPPPQEHNPKQHCYHQENDIAGTRYRVLYKYQVIYAYHSRREVVLQYTVVLHYSRNNNIKHTVVQLYKVPVLKKGVILQLQFRATDVQFYLRPPKTTKTRIFGVCDKRQRDPAVDCGFLWDLNELQGRPSL